MALQHIQDKILSAKIKDKLPTKYRYGQVANRNYEGEIKQKGDTVRIISFADITMQDYVKDTNMNAPTALSDSETTLVINQAKSFNVGVDALDMATTKLNLMDVLANKASSAIANTVDTYLASLYTQINTANFIGNDANPIALTKDNAYDYLVDMGTILDDNDVPAEGRYIIVPNWLHGLLLKDDRFTKSNQLSEKTLVNGVIGEVNGMMVLKSNNVPHVSNEKYKIIAGYTESMSLAVAIQNVKIYEPELRFGSAMKGLVFFGGKVVRPNTMACLVANKSNT